VLIISGGSENDAREDFVSLLEISYSLAEISTSSLPPIGIRSSLDRSMGITIGTCGSERRETRGLVRVALCGEVTGTGSTETVRSFRSIIITPCLQ
jgi:hypothetical protein